MVFREFSYFLCHFDEKESPCIQYNEWSMEYRAVLFIFQVSTLIIWYYPLDS